MAEVGALTDRRYRAVRSRDRRFDGTFFTAVRTTGIYCRPSCPAVTPKPGNVTFYPSAAAAQQAGYRACRRCAPDATPGSPDWDVRADVAGRAMRLVNDGLVEREGVPGLARRLGYTPRHLGRLLTRELGAGPLALARARRAQTARILIQTTGMPFADVAFAAGFASVRQFNATVAEVFGQTPSRLRGTPGRSVPAAPGSVRLRLAVRAPFDGDLVLGFLAAGAIPGVEWVRDGGYGRALSLPHGPAVVVLTPGPDGVACELRGLDLRDLGAAVERCRRLLDLDADPVAVAGDLGADPVLGALVRDRPGLRVPGTVDGPELAVRSVVGQGVSVAACRALLGRLVAEHGRPVDQPGGGHLSQPRGIPVRQFPTAEALAALDPGTLPLPQARARALVGLCAAVADGRVVLDRSADRADVRTALLALPGIGPWTADHVLMRALGDPDAYLPGDLGVRQALRRLGADPDDTALAERWRPWRSYAVMHLWSTLPTATGEEAP